MLALLMRDRLSKANLPHNQLSVAAPPIPTRRVVWLTFPGEIQTKATILICSWLSRWQVVALLLVEPSVY